MLIADFLPRILLEVPGCPSAVARNALLEVGKRFFMESQVWNEILADVTLEDGQRSYTIASPAGGKLIDVKAVYANWQGQGHLVGVSMQQLAMVMPAWRTQEGGLPTHYTRAFAPDRIDLFPLPMNTAGRVIQVHAVYTLADNATQLPDDLIAKYGETLASGVKSKLLLMPKAAASWSDPRMGEYHRVLYVNGMVSAKVDAAHSQTTGDIVVPPRRFGF